MGARLLAEYDRRGPFRVDVTGREDYELWDAAMLLALQDLLRYASVEFAVSHFRRRWHIFKEADWDQWVAEGKPPQGVERTIH